MKNITQVYFSPGKTTAKVSDLFCTQLNTTYDTIDLMKKDTPIKKEFNKEELAVFCLPVFSGRLPSVAASALEHIKGNGTYAVAMVVYGNRAYEDALLELCELLSSKGFVLIGAGAFIARHSIFQEVAKNRPDEADTEKIREFADKCMEKIHQQSGTVAPLVVKGNKPYRNVSPIPLVPTASSACTKCNVCVRICPTDAISKQNPKKTDKQKCISCTACIYHCPHNARSFRSILYPLAKRSFFKKFGGKRNEPELFV